MYKELFKQVLSTQKKSFTFDKKQVYLVLPFLGLLSHV